MNISEISRIAWDFCNAYEIDQDDFLEKGMCYDKKFNNFVTNHDIFLLGRKAEEQKYIEALEMLKCCNIELAKRTQEMQAMIEKHHLERFFNNKGA